MPALGVRSAATARPTPPSPRPRRTKRLPTPPPARAARHRSTSPARPALARARPADSQPGRRALGGRLRRAGAPGLVLLRPGRPGPDRHAGRPHPSSRSRHVRAGRLSRPRRSARRRRVGPRCVDGCRVPSRHARPRRRLGRRPRHRAPEGGPILAVDVRASDAQALLDRADRAAHRVQVWLLCAARSIWFAASGASAEMLRGAHMAVPARAAPRPPCVRVPRRLAAPRVGPPGRAGMSAGRRRLPRRPDDRDVGGRPCRRCDGVGHQPWRRPRGVRCLVPMPPRPSTAPHACGGGGVVVLGDIDPALVGGWATALGLSEAERPLHTPWRLLVSGVHARARAVRASLGQDLQWLVNGCVPDVSAWVCPLV